MPEFAVSEEESKKFCEKSLKVLRHHPSIIQKINQKSVDYTEWFGTVASMTGTRVVAYKLRKASEARPTAGATVHPFPNMQPG